MKGPVKIATRTKNLIPRLVPGDIAIICHRDLDELAAGSLVRKRVRAVINLEPSISGKYPNKGPKRLLEAGILLADVKDPQTVSEIINEGNVVEIKDKKLYHQGIKISDLEVYSPGKVDSLLSSTQKNLEKEFNNFVENTLYFARKEKSLLFGLKVPEIATKIRGRHVLIVVRGQDYRADLKALDSYIKDLRPLIIAVDGGADACLECGFIPDIIIGDMDSISNRALQCGAEIIVHAYPDGKAPGLKRVESLGLPAKIFPAPGLSEDVAMLLAYEKGADLIVAVGTHNNIIDFLEKGRPGMASTLLVRMKIGSRLVDARGVSKLYKSKISPFQWMQLVLAALLPFLVVMLVSPSTQQFLRLFYLQLKVIIQSYIF